MTDKKVSENGNGFPVRAGDSTTESMNVPLAASSNSEMANGGDTGGLVNADKPKVPQYFRRDKLRSIENDIRAGWEKANIFEADVDPSKESYMITFPFPYMNGRIHIGHAFTLTKADFTAAYQKLKGKNVLFPFGFHVTGMPISASANKIQHELESYGNPPKIVDSDESIAPDESKPTTSVPGSFKGKKTKLTSKTQKAKLQWDILKDMGIPENQIARFADPNEWLDYFPKLGEQDLKLFGSHCDWRRSFITSSSNGFYDQFIRWQFLRLRENQKVDFGRRATVYSPLDKQACADHDRSSGEGVCPQEYTLIKLKVLELPEGIANRSPSLVSAVEKGNLFLVAATLRPETMYGQTNCFVLPSGEYGAYEFNVQVSDGKREPQVLVCAERAALNMSYQDPFSLEDDWGKIKLVEKIQGKELVGCPVAAPKTKYDRVYCLPLMTISMNKGTGVVTSVPSDAPDDFAALRDWQTDSKLREKHRVAEYMVEIFKPLPIIDIPGFGDLCAVTMCEKLKIKTQNDTKKLAEAKEVTYKEGFYKGIMLVGENDGVKGLKVSEAKEICKNIMVKSGEAFIYYEPEREVIARSGSTCVVAYLDQWFIKYGEPNWAAEVRAHVKDPDRLETFTPATRKAFLEVVDWLREWACSRNFGLGTRLPWDEQFVIESLSDSTIYMAYYTISHLLQGRKDENDFTGDGGNGSPLSIQPHQLIPEVFDFIFLGKDYPKDCTIPESSLIKLRESFEYWYPMNLRVSGRDLIQNHLTMSLYNHAAIWNEKPELMPKAFFANGFVQIEGEKMSKSVGNFILLEEAIQGHRIFTLNGKEVVVGWTADATRLALADAGDGLDDANFSCEVADKGILRLTTELEWLDSIFSDEGKEKLRHDESFNFWDRAFDGQLDLAVLDAEKSYESMRFRDVLKFGFYELLGSRDAYRDACSRIGVPLNYRLIEKFVRIFSIIMSPVLPHFCEYVWRTYLKQDSFIYHATWPVVSTPDLDFLRSVDFLVAVCREVRVKMNLEMKKMQKKGQVKAIEAVRLSISTQYPSYQAAVLKFLNEKLDYATLEFPADIMKQLKVFVSGQEDLKKFMKNALQKAAFVIERVKKERSAVALETSVPFDQASVLSSQRQFCIDSMGLPFTIEESEHANSAALPGSPSIEFCFAK